MHQADVSLYHLDCLGVGEGAVPIEQGRGRSMFRVASGLVFM